MTLFCLFSLSIVKIAGLRSLWCPLSGLLEVCGSHSTAVCQVILHWVWTGFWVLRLETLDCFLFHILQKSIFVCLFIEQVMWLGSKCKFHVLGGSPNSISIRLPLIQKPAPGVWGERDLGRATYRALAWAPFQDRLTFAFLVSFLFFFFEQKESGIWHRLVLAASSGTGWWLPSGWKLWLPSSSRKPEQQRLEPGPFFSHLLALPQTLLTGLTLGFPGIYTRFLLDFVKWGQMLTSASADLRSWQQKRRLYRVIWALGGCTRILLLQGWFPAGINAGLKLGSSVKGSLSVFWKRLSSSAQDDRMASLVGVFGAGETGELYMKIMK